jgi:hypothetical protein
MSLVGAQPILGWSASPPYPKSPPNFSLGSLKRMGGTSKGLPFTFETSLEKVGHPPINKGPLYAKMMKHLSIVMLLIF